jgi:hypothetical protein
MSIRMSATTPAEHPRQDPLQNPEAWTPCISCRTLIRSDASLCPTCRSYQVNWKNALSYFGPTAGFIAILASAVTFIATQAYQWYVAATWTDSVAPVYFEYPGDSGFINSGDGAVVISSVFVRWGERPEQTINIPINKQVNKGEFVVASSKPLYEEAHDVNGAPWARNASGALHPRLVAEATKYAEPKRCAEYHLFNSRHLVFRLIDSLGGGKQLISGNVSAQLNMVSLHSGAPFSLKLDDVRMAFLFIEGNRPGCTADAFGVEK